LITALLSAPVGADIIIRRAPKPVGQQGTVGQRAIACESWEEMDRIHKAVTAKPPDLETVRQLRDGDGIYGCIWLEPGLVVTIIESKKGGGMGHEVGAATKGDRDGEVGNIYHLFEKKGGTPSEKSAVDPFPVVKWVSIKNGRTEDDGMEDKAAKFIQNQNTLLVNADFRVFKDMIARLCREKDAGIGDLQSTVEEVVHQWFEQALVESVVSSR
jgi:hypothetical protein